MLLTELIKPEGVFVHLAIPSKAKLLDWASSQARSETGSDERAVQTALREREKLGSTGIGGGIAIPHAPVPGLIRPFGLVACLASPVDFEAVDDLPVDIVCIALVPEAGQSTCLNLLAKLARRLRSDDVVRRLRHASTPSDAYNALIA